jgi:hypothetical protein
MALSHPSLAWRAANDRRRPESQRAQRRECLLYRHWEGLAPQRPVSRSYHSDAQTIPKSNGRGGAAPREHRHLIRWRNGALQHCGNTGRATVGSRHRLPPPKHLITPAVSLGKRILWPDQGSGESVARVHHRRISPGKTRRGRVSPAKAQPPHLSPLA